MKKHCKDLEVETEYLKQWILRNYGERCLEEEDTCPVCHAWKCFEILKLK